ncbi:MULTISPECIES: MBL fold metallo-hydrolase [Streptomyces]|uniref:MBL fold metallo-hydrolase n=1 Tax=Streptomyces lonegramiae TaxID=3075524 RepID=A0ABU2XHP7_9ACTN|nr:MBL fold metallo-hydrolase [Streptomyces sp. DSM 41529]MDT0544979.1 MBL fold metallo-hydrolase [Streptomyces sp. DSM 41529]
MNDEKTPRFNRRLLFRGAAAGAAVPMLSAAPGAATTPRRPGSRTGKASGAEFRWLGTTGWRIDFDGRTVLSDPYLTRFKTGLFEGSFNARTELETDEALVGEHIGRPELVLVSHSHWDHFNDVPFIARSTEARIVGTETTYHLLRAFGIDANRMIVVKGGEVLDFGGYVVEVVSSRHSRNKAQSYFAPGTLNAPPAARPETISDLPEGDTLAFQVTVGDGPSAFLMGASDFSARDAEGLRPDVAMVAVPNSFSTHRYVPRLLKTLGYPGTVVPVHWDVFENPLKDGPQEDPTMDLAGFRDQVRAAAPGTRILLPDYLTSYRF